MMRQYDTDIINSNKSLDQKANKLLRRFNRKKVSKKERKRISYERSIPKKYTEYIKSKFWRERKFAYYRKFGKKCSLCQITVKIQLHHLVYRDFGREKDEHLIPLCETHHREFHENNEIGHNMVTSTHQFIQDKQEEEEFNNITKNF